MSERHGDSPNQISPKFRYLEPQRHRIAPGRASKFAAVSTHSSDEPEICTSSTCQQASQWKVSTRRNHDAIISASAGASSRSICPETIRTEYPGEAGTRGVPPIRPVRFNGSVAERTIG